MWKKSRFMLIQSIRLKSIQPKGFSLSKFVYIIGLVNQLHFPIILTIMVNLCKMNFQ